ncbi:MAG: HAD-IIB family hydrolase [bacterium]|nr:HAD-IIB family hydrolase [bacterium]
MPPLVMFDLDQTLAESKQALTPQMAELLARLLTQTRVAVISGGGLPQFLKQVVEQLPPSANLSRLYLLPTSGAALYEWKSGQWSKVYEEKLSEQDAALIKEAVKTVAQETGLVDFSKPAYGERIEYRGSEVTFSALGQKAPLNEKQAWDPDKSKRRLLQKALTECLPEYSICLPNFEVGMGGATSIDITKKGIDKAYGITKISEHLSIPIAEMLYVGDQLEPGGNDEAATRTAIKTHAVKNPSETAFFIASLLSA